MRLFTKIFLCGMLVFGLTFSASGYFLLHYSMLNSVSREVDFALNQYQYDKFTVQSALLTTYITMNISIPDTGPDGISTVFVWQGKNEGEPGIEVKSGAEEKSGSEEKPGAEGKSGSEEKPDTEEKSGAEEKPGAGGSPGTEEEFWDGEILREALFDGLAAEINAPVAFFAEDRTPLYSEIEGLDPGFLEELSGNAHVYRFWNTPEGSSILVGSMLGRDGQNGEWDPLYFITQWDIGKTVKQQENMRDYFVRFYGLAMGAGMVLFGLLSVLVTGPLKRMAGASRRMAEGYYEERLAVSGRDEIGELAESFNQMADAVEEKMGELRKAAREKEDFVANFAHELKTPLTSIIGYADMLYQKELPREEVRKASWYIWNEGMRMEALSLKLMDLIVLGRQDFPLQEMPAEELLQDVAEGLCPVFADRKIKLSLRAEPAYVRVDCDLLKTLLINLADNSAKACSTRIELTGSVEEGKYWIHVRDNGCGIEEEELSRVTEAFYMVDKARSRKQHGAGLGLALAERIARLHGGELIFASRKGEGTDVSFCLRCEKGGAEDGTEDAENEAEDTGNKIEDAEDGSEDLGSEAEDVGNGMENAKSRTENAGNGAEEEENGAENARDRSDT